MKCLRFSKVGTHAFVQAQCEIPSSGPFQVLVYLYLLLDMDTTLGLRIQTKVMCKIDAS